MSQLNVDSIKDRTGADQPDIVGVAKAFVNFNGTGTVAIRNGFNVSSITDNGTGDYTVNFTNAMVDANYSISGSYGFSGIASNVSSIRPRLDSDVLVGSLRIYTSSVGGGASALGDPTTCTVAIFR